MNKAICIILVFFSVAGLYGAQFLIHSEAVNSIGGSEILNYQPDNIDLENVSENKIIYVHFFITDVADFDGFELKINFPPSHLEFVGFEPSTGNISNIFNLPLFIDNVFEDSVTIALTSGGVESNSVAPGEYAYLGSVLFNALQDDPRGISLSHLKFVDNSAMLYFFADADTMTSFGGGVLPVELSAFSAEWSDDGIALSWRTENEYNALGFHILRSLSKDGPFERINKKIINTTPDFEFPHDYLFVDKNVLAYNNYFYNLVQIDRGGQLESYGPLSIYADASAVQNFQLYQNYPNPFNSSTIIRYSLSQDEVINLKIININGQVVRQLKNGFTPTGIHTVLWDGTDDQAKVITSGVYWCILQSPNNYVYKKIAILR